MTREVICNCIFWRNFHRQLREAKDPYGMINHKEVQMIICRLNHVQKEDWHIIIEGAKKRNMIMMMGRNQYGCFYKVN